VSGIPASSSSHNQRPATIADKLNRGTGSLLG
jgi:hypothetical protein